MAVTREQVIWAYQTLLLREPEDEQAIAEKMASNEDRIDLIMEIVKSDEFKSQLS